ncbi:MAG: class I SAM-dependent methyltransferase [Nitrospirota bacterium]
MKRIPEPEELMDDEEQAIAYAGADFEEPHSRFITLFKETFGSSSISGYVLDIGCGPGDITFRFARAYPNCIVHGVDGAEAMLSRARKILENSTDLKDRVKLFHGILPDALLRREKYDIIISNSLLHHLHNPQILWDAVKLYAAPQAPVFIMDLKRPESPDEARQLVETYSGKEPEILKRDFFNSLLAAFEVVEVKEQLEIAGLSHFTVTVVSDRHMVISGYIN